VGEVLRLTTANALPLVSALPADVVATYDLTARYHLALGLAIVAMLAATCCSIHGSAGHPGVREDEEAGPGDRHRPAAHKLLALALSSLLAGWRRHLRLLGVSYYRSWRSAQPGRSTPADHLRGGLGTLLGHSSGGLLRAGARAACDQSGAIHQVIFGICSS